ncbi:2-oxoisovalerate dehydrogenase subunit beta, mitochondrial isoform X2 [Hypanus sabinus]|uniref:2-oxoisovalerate dehydrogenase subunit beta, mitochondrial isoform X2 n=1 Tax=Hypanus sabinus TaxID=79690 RepID=UPI0028C4FE0F|nr:2-oxoisovalerate dehydrogenase subunit beta, mitochondrial isoform X2 [Hypanus sabinus]XP_059838355.1 2-oxoisovalerate dehydrogenase subunit beta, mitochondrial isoform X2 [Hypanus sabinus]XP_059838356.1 2-oxoisovalerate dehydrogenase subunit beta, mitochondrial isoform X2 [Hypanus sabinus]XP_059838357.1 2-oxoisovalerate dehydrogenase subunit beta, mitochondrial isoform X2 [Hypanus sabinus]
MKSSKVKESKGEEVDLPLARRKVLEAGDKDENQIELLKGPELDMDDLSGLAELFEEVENSKGVPDNEMRAVLDEKGALTLKKSAGLADEVVSARGVEFTPEGSCPESSWENQGNLEFGPGTGIESLEEASVLFECVQDVDAHGTEPSNGAQKKSEVFDSVDKEGSPCGSDRLGSAKKGLTLVIVGSESSQVFVLEGVLKVNVEIKSGEMNIIIEGNGKYVVPKSNDENLKPADHLQVELEDDRAPHAIVIPECGVKRQNLKCCLNKEFELKTNSLKGPEEKASNLCKIKELGGNSEDGLSLGHSVDKITPMKKAGEAYFPRVPKLPTWELTGKEARVNGDAIFK